MKISPASLSFLVLLASSSLEHNASAFQPATFGRRTASFVRPLAAAAADSDGDDEPKKVNPYQDENYPDLEFIDYSDPEYKVDQGEEFFDPESDDTEEQIEIMREDRRRRNDEFQFETYFDKILKGGAEYFGEWSVYKTSTFIKDDAIAEEDGVPRIVRARLPIKVKSRGYKIEVESESEFRVDGARICHEELMEEGAEAATGEVCV